MKNIVLTIGREYGSGGRYIGEMVSKKLNIPFYDRVLIEKAYEKIGGNYSKIDEYDEVVQNKFLKNLNLINTSNSELAYEESSYQILMSKIIKELAEAGSCVILGRNANNVLRDQKNVINIFIYSNDLDFKVKRKMKLENISYDEALNRLKQVDKKRRKYYESINNRQKWGDRTEYNYLIDSGVLGVDKTVDLIVDIYNKASL